MNSARDDYGTAMIVDCYRMSRRLTSAFTSLVLFFTAWLLTGSFIRDDVFMYGDHAGHYWTLWYTLNVAVPEHHRLIDWIPYWYAGYPERLFYPPGTMVVGWLLNLLTLGKLSTALIYESILFIAYALPAFTFYYALRRFGFEARAAFAAGMFALGFPTFFDGAHAVVIGMTGSRLSFGLNALVLVWTIDFIETRRWRYALLAAPTLALAIRCGCSGCARARGVLAVADAGTLVRCDDSAYPRHVRSDVAIAGGHRALAVRAPGVDGDRACAS